MPLKVLFGIALLMDALLTMLLPPASVADTLVFHGGFFRIA
jgi:hypothetical protein